MYRTAYPSVPQPGMDVASLFPQVTNIINQSRNVVNAPQSQPTNIDEVQRLLGSLTTEQRSVVESDQSYLLQKSLVLEEFLVWCISSTPVGKEYLTTIGDVKSRQLLDVTRDLCSKAPSVANSQIDELKRVIIEQQKQFTTQMETQSKQIEELAAFKAQFGEEAHAEVVQDV